MYAGRLCVVGLIGLAWSACGLAESYKVPRLADGTPDFQGVWTNATATPLERPAEFGHRRALTKEEADAIEARERGRVAADAAPSDPNKKIEAVAALPPVGNYNLFWTDRGMTPALIDGEYRTSIIIDPPNGRIPPLTEEARNRPRRSLGVADGPESRSLGERCLLSFGSSAGPPMLPTMYNSYYQIVQSPGHVMILVEMVHDARIVRIDGQPVPRSIRKWMGDSIGHWAGDTLVVRTTNIRPEQALRGGTAENMVVTERFTRVADDQINYRFTVEDPTTFTAPFSGELAFMRVDAQVYEYACHEGNYALPGILAAEREAEKRVAEEAAKSAQQKKK
jgi:hypothetical protein